MTQANKSNLKDPDSQKVEVVVQSPEGEVNIFEGKLVIQFAEEKVSAFTSRCQEIPFHS